MRTTKGIHYNVAVEEIETHLECPDFSFEYSFSHFSHDSGGGAGDSSDSFNRDSTASLTFLFSSSLRYFSSPTSRIRVPSFLFCLAAISSRVLYCFSVNKTWIRCGYFIA